MLSPATKHTGPRCALAECDALPSRRPLALAHPASERAVPTTHAHARHGARIHEAAPPRSRGARLTLRPSAATVADAVAHSLRPCLGGSLSPLLAPFLLRPDAALDGAVKQRRLQVGRLRTDGLASGRARQATKRTAPRSSRTKRSPLPSRSSRTMAHSAVERAVPATHARARRGARAHVAAPPRTRDTHLALRPSAATVGARTAHSLRPCPGGSRSRLAPFLPRSGADAAGADPKAGRSPAH